jgi:hypothetical protein
MLISDRITNIEQYKYNPALMQRAALDALSSVSNGTIDIVDATNPFVFALETTAVNTAAFIQHTEAINRRQYPAASVTADDLYLHMSDKDYVGRFALPSTTTFTMIISKDELLNALVLDPITKISKITIPRNTVFTVADINFSLQYPIDIRKMQHGGLQIVYDTSVLSPLYVLETNVIDWEETHDPSNNAYITFSFLVHQFDIITKFNNVTAASGFNTTIPFSDQFYYVRVYNKESNGQYKELLTTHTDQVYNPKTPTAVIKVIDQNVVVNIPSIYLNNGLVRGSVRIDVYQTKGLINKIMSNYKLDDFSAKWLAIDPADDTVYTAAIKDIKTIIFYSSETTKGGRAALSADELMTRVINNSIGPQSLPITNIQLQNSIQDAGYDFIKNIDTITNRVFLATKPMVEPIDSTLVTAAASSMSRVTTTFAEAAEAYGVNVSDTRTIITSDALYLNTNGVTRLVSKNNYSVIDLLNNSNKCDYLNNNDFVYSPFHYVLDTDNNIFKVRPYYLDDPKITSKSFVSENPLTEVQVNIGTNYVIEKLQTGYKITIKTKSNDLFKQLDDNTVFCQLAFKATGQTLYSYLLGTQLTRTDPDADERVFVFNLQTNFDINSNHQIAQNSFRFSNTGLSTFSDLFQEMHIFFITNNSTINNIAPIEADGLIGKFQLPSSSFALSHEKIKVRFGYFLSNLWSRAKSISTSIEYMRYTENIPAYYSEDVYDIDPITNSCFTFSPSGDLVYKILHRKNDPMLDSNDNPIYKHKVGDIVLNEDGNPIPVNSTSNQVTRYVDITTIEGVYKFATDPSSITYRKSMVDSMVDWIINDIPRFNLSLLDQTKIFFYPKVTQGFIQCNAGDGNLVTIPATQTFNLVLHVPPETYNDAILIKQLNKITIEVINSQLNKNTITVSDIEYELKNKYGNDVIDVVLSGFGENNNLNAITILDKTSKMSIKKKLILLPNNLLILQEDVNIEYIKHTVN